VTVPYVDFRVRGFMAPSAPLELAAVTMAVRDALADPPPEEVDGLAGECRLAAHAVALSVRRSGWKTACVPASRLGDGHFVAVTDTWVLDPTAEQFGIGGPVVCRTDELSSESYPLELLLDDAFAPSELELICRLAWRWSTAAENRAMTLLRATGLTSVSDAVRNAAVEDPQPADACFCGAPASGVWIFDMFSTAGCVDHLAIAERCG